MDARSLKGFLVGAGVALAVMAYVITSKQPAPVPPPSTPPAPPALPAAPMPAQPQTPREAADQLFNAAMTAAERRDEATSARLLPGAMAAYRALAPLDGDGLFHLAALELAAGKYDDALATCATLLATQPNHLLALGLSLRSAERKGDLPAARAFAQRLLAAYDAESVRPLPEYQDHQRLLPTYRTEAQARLP